MTKFFDGKNILEITIQERTGSGYTPDWSADFFGAGRFTFNGSIDAHVINCDDSLEYMIEYAEDWENCRGDFYEDEDPDGDRFVSACIYPATKEQLLLFFIDEEINDHGKHLTACAYTEAEGILVGIEDRGLTAAGQQDVYDRIVAKVNELGGISEGKMITSIHVRFPED